MKMIIVAGLAMALALSTARAENGSNVDQQLREDGDTQRLMDIAKDTEAQHAAENAQRQQMVQEGIDNYNRQMDRRREARNVDARTSIFGYTQAMNGVAMLSRTGCIVKGSVANGWHLGIFDAGGGTVSVACWAKDFNSQIGQELVTFCEATHSNQRDWTLSPLSSCLIIGADRVLSGDPRPRQAFN